MKKVPGKVPDKVDSLLLWGLSLFPILTPPTIPHPRPNTPVSSLQSYNIKLVSSMPLNTSMSPGAMGYVGGGRVRRNKEGSWKGSH